VPWKNNVERGRQQIKIWRMYIACWIIRATDTHSEFVILIAFPQQKLLQERASMLRYTYMVCLSYFRQFISDLTRWATTQVVSICPVATEARFRSWTSPCETFDVECNTRPCFYPSNSVVLCQYHPTSASSSSSCTCSSYQEDKWAMS